MTAALQQPGVLGISPTHPITLEGKGGTCKVEVLFKPTGRIPQFMEEVCTLGCLLYNGCTYIYNLKYLEQLLTFECYRK